MGGVQAWDRSNARGADGRWESKEGRLTLQFIAYTSHGASYVYISAPLWPPPTPAMFVVPGRVTADKTK